MKNYAGVTTADDAIAAELEAAGIEVHRLSESCRKDRSEMRTIIRGSLHGWMFQRAWYYWVAEGPGIELQAADKLHSTHGTCVRVAGHCGCPSPRDWYGGLACGLYHVDTQDGLNALASTIRRLIVQPGYPAL